MGGCFWSRRFNCDKFLIGIVAIALAFVIWRICLPARLHCVEIGGCTWRLIDGQNSMLTLADGKDWVGPGDILLWRNGNLLYGSCVGGNGKVEMFIYEIDSRWLKRFSDETQGVLEFKNRGLRLDDCVAFSTLRSAPNRKELSIRLTEDKRHE